MQTPDQLIVYARKIYEGYATLENGLPPLDVLNAHYELAQQEFDAALTNKDIWQQYSKAANLLHYTACIDMQIKYNTGREPLPFYHYYKQFGVIREAGLHPKKAEKAALVKYGWFASSPANRDEDFKLALLQNAW